MKVIAHHTKGHDFHAKYRCEEFQSISNPLSSVIEVFARDRIITTQKTASYAAIDAMDDLYFVIRQYFTSIDTSHGCPRILKTEPNSHTTIRRIEKIDLIETWMAPADSAS